MGKKEKEESEFVRCVSKFQDLQAVYCVCFGDKGLCVSLCIHIEKDTLEDQGQSTALAPHFSSYLPKHNILKTNMKAYT